MQVFEFFTIQRLEIIRQFELFKKNQSSSTHQFIL